MILKVSLIAALIGCLALAGCTHSPYVYGSGGPRVVDPDAELLDEELENVENVRDRPLRGYTPAESGGY
jgi:hypothetical protein